LSPQFLTIAYTTQNEPYLSLSESLKESCSRFNIPFYLKVIPDLGSWERNTHYKANFILECMEKFYNPYLVYVDVDATFRAYPSLFESLDTDVAFRTENFKWRQNEPLSGTVFLKNNDHVKEFVKSWIDTNNSIPALRRDPLTWEQYNMKRALDKHPELTYYNLPPEYTFVFDHTRTLFPGLEPVIIHGQASRRVLK
jgi:hypothetical protein